MARRYPRGRRRRPGRRPPNRYSGRGGPTQHRGFTGSGFGSVYRVLLPGLGGREKRMFFNKISASLPLGAGLGGTVAGLGIAGPLGGALGLAAGLMVGAWVAQKGGRFYRA